MDYSEKIDQFLDGELDPLHEPGLFGELSSNADLRADFRQQLELKTAVQNDRMALVPPAALTNSVFSSLGFAAPLAGVTSGAASGGLLLQWFARIGVPVLSALAAAGISFGIANNSSTPNVPSGNAANGSSTTINSSSIDTTARTGDATKEPLSTNSNTYITANSARSTSPEAQVVYRDRVIYRDRIVNVQKDAEARLATENSELRSENEKLRAKIGTLETQLSNAPIANAQQNIMAMPATEVRVVNTLQVKSSPDARVISPTTLNIERYITQYPGYTAQIRSFPLTSTLETDVDGPASWYTNWGVSFLYQLNSNHAIGVEVGNENFPMIFEGTRNGQVIRYEQNSPSAWGGIMYRYAGNRLTNSSLSPFLQGVFGGTKFGPIARLAGGIQYSPVGPLTFSLGLEGSAMAYSFQSNYYFSPKYGMTFGVGARF